MGTGKFNAWDNRTIDHHLIQGGVEILHSLHATETEISSGLNGHLILHILAEYSCYMKLLPPEIPFDDTLLCVDICRLVSFLRNCRQTMIHLQR